MSNRYVEVAGNLRKLIDLGATTLPDEAGGFRHAYGLADVPVDGSGNPIGSGIQAVSIDQTTPGTTNYVETRGNTRRSSGIVHRSAITAVDKCLVPGSPTMVDVATGGSLAQGTAYNVTVAAGTVHGSTTVPANGTVTTAASGGSVHAVRVTLAQIANATVYDLFMSTDANPKWVARITETQRAAGCTVTAVGTVSATTPGAGLVDVQVVGTGVASNVAPFTFNNAYVTAGITPVDCRGYGVVLANWRLAVTDLRSAPTIAFIVFWLDNQSQQYHFFSNVNAPTPTLLTALRQPLDGVIQFNTQGASSMMILIDTLSGQGASASISVELA